VSKLCGGRTLGGRPTAGRLSPPKKIDIPPQQLTTFNRTGFSVVEWGGTEVR